MVIKEGQFLEVTISKRNIEWYLSQNYDCALKDKMLVKVEDLTPSNNSYIEVLCDYCLDDNIETIIPIPYSQHTKIMRDHAIKKHSCMKCKGKKIKESNLLKYGVENVMHLKESKDKIKETCIEKYGVEHPMFVDQIKDKIKDAIKDKYGTEYYFQTNEFKEQYKNTMQEKYGEGIINAFQAEEVKEKSKKTMLEKFGVQHNMQSEIIQEKTRQTNIERYGTYNYAKTDEFKEKYQETMNENYGVDHYSQTDDYKIKFKNTSLERYGVEHTSKLDSTKQKAIETNLERYGYEWHMQTDDFVDKMVAGNMKRFGVAHAMQDPEINKRARETMYKNGSAPASNQQIYIANLLKGKLNYPFGNCNIDIAFLENMIAFEYDGGGHDLSVKLGEITENEFQQKEMRRNYFLRRNGWKMIKLISSKDKIPQDDVIIEIFEFSKDYFNTGHRWIEFDVDNKTVKSSQFFNQYDYGKLRGINKSVDIEEAI